MTFPNRDKYWLEAEKFLSKHVNKADIILAPGEFSSKFPNVYYYTATTIKSQNKKLDSFQWAVIHKGLMQMQLDFHVLKKIKNKLNPVFANDVFVIFSGYKAIPKINKNSPHYISFLEKLKQRKPFHKLLKNKIKTLLKEQLNPELNESETIGNLIKSKDNYLWIRRDSSTYLGVNHDETVGIDPHHEALLQEYISKNASKDKLFVDIGAHVGFFTIRLANKFKEICSIEPNPSNLKALKINLILNNIKNVKVYELGCWNEAKEDIIYAREGGSFLKNSLSRKTDDIEYPVKLVTLDSILKNIKDSMVIKIDTEGAELPILQGAVETLKKNNILWIIEHHEGVYADLKGRRQEIINFMSKYIYKPLEDLNDPSKLIFKK